MNDFFIYFQIGFKHITDFKGIDHILFIAALCLRYQFSDWKKILILVTAFTIGHSITLVLSTLNLIKIQTIYIEFLIPITIIITAISNLFIKKFNFKKTSYLIYYLALFFGLIHGLGFSNYLKSLLGSEENIILPLFAFNIGLEIGQIIIVLIILLLTFIFITIYKLNRREYLLVTNGIIIGLALQMALLRNPFKNQKNETTHASIEHFTYIKCNSSI